MSPAPLASFDYNPRTRIVFGSGKVQLSGQLAVELGGRRVLLVTDPGIVAAGHAEHVMNSLKAAGLEVFVFSKAEENPTTDTVDKCLVVARESKVDLIIGLGGGSSMDTAKGCNFLLTNGGRMQDYWGVGKATKPMLPLIAIPTTAGTGSECQSAALIADAKTHQKMACLDPKVLPRIAILDPALTCSQPARVTACTGMDAIAHAVETAVTTRRNAMSSMFAREAFRLCADAFPVVLREPQNIDARSRMLLGASFAGLAIENSMLGAAHAAANPLTAHFGVVHGEAVGLMLPHVVRFNTGDPTAAHEYAMLFGSNGCTQGRGDLASLISQLLSQANLNRSLADHGISRADLSQLAEEAAKQWTGGFNPRPLSKSDFQELYAQAL